MKFAPLARRARFGIAALMGFVLVVALILGWIVFKARTQADAIAAIKRAGGSVAYDREYDSGKIVYNPPSDRLWLRRHLGQDFFDRVAWVELGVGTDAESVMDHVARLADLQQLNLRFSNVTDRGVAKLIGLKKLRGIGLAGPGLTSAVIETLGKIPSLEGIGLEGIPFEDANVVHLTRLTRLQGLPFDDSPITDAGMKLTTAFPDLVSASLKNTKITDAGLAYLKGCSKLQNADVDGTRVTAAGIEQLAGLPAFYVVTARDTAVTDEDVLRLQAKFPKLKIYR